MQIYKLYLKMIKKEVPFLLLGLAVFLMTAGMAVSGSRKREEAVLGQGAVKIAWYSEDGETELLKSFLDYLEKSGAAVTLEGKEARSVKEFEKKAGKALQRGQITASLTAPSGFTARFLAGEDTALVRRQSPGLLEGARLDFMINRFFQTAALYRDYGERMPPDALPEVSEVSFYQSGGMVRRQARYADAMGYGLLVLIVTAVGGSILAFQRNAVNCRSQAAPAAPGRIYAKLLAADGLLALCIWAVMCGMMLFYIPVQGFDIRTLLLMQNTLVFLMFALSLGILTGVLLGCRRAGPAAQAISLFLAAMGGVFLPLPALPHGIAQAARFLPAYWFVSANDKIGELSDVTLSGLTEIYQCMLVVALFALALLAVSLAAGKRERLKPGP